MAEKAKTWTGMVGKDAEEVKASILADGEYEVVIVEENAPATEDVLHTRVQIFKGQDGKVIHDPSTG